MNQNPEMSQNDSSPQDTANVSGASARGAILALREEIAKAVVGQDGVVSGIITALLVQGHVLLEGVPGTAKTLLVKSIAAALNVDFGRVQFTPDLMPSDITGQTLLEMETNTFRFRPGPIFTNLLLADEINRTPPKTQAALLEAMEERQVTFDGVTQKLPDPFIVIATQNPIETEGTYPLPEAQLDRFLLKLQVGYPTEEQEQEILARHDAGMNPHDLFTTGIRPVATVEDLAQARAEIQNIRVDIVVQKYIVSVVALTRKTPTVSMGVSPRGSVALLQVSKAWAWLSGRDYVTPDDVKIMSRSVLRHRLHIRPEYELEGSNVDNILANIFASVPVPR